MIEFREVELIIKDKIIPVSNYIFEKDSKYVIHAPSGKGKTTLMESIMGLRSNVNGIIKVNGKNVDAKHIYEIRNEISYLPQELPMFNEKVINIINELVPSYSEQQLEELLHLVDLHEHKLMQNYLMLSGGEKKRLGLLITLLLNRQIVLLDELDHGIDEGRLKNILNHLSHIEGLVIINSHHPVVLNHQGFKVLGGELID